MINKNLRSIEFSTTGIWNWHAKKKEILLIDVTSVEGSIKDFLSSDVWISLNCVVGWVEKLRIIMVNTAINWLINSLES